MKWLCLSVVAMFTIAALAPILYAAPGLLVQAAVQVERGKNVFAASCAKCHGAQGQGTGDGPRLIGSPNALAEHETAAKLYDFIKTNMPYNNAGTLKDEEYWDVLAFVLDGNKLLPPGITLGPETAERITLRP